MEKVIGVQKFLHDIKYRRDRFRQFLGISFIILVSAAGEPTKNWFIPGAVLVILGISVRLWASGHIKKNKALATDGPYAFVRHPLYVGNITLGFGFALASGLWWGFPLLMLFLLGFYPQAIRHEDAKLHHLFKDKWEQWQSETRALIPRFILLRKDQRGGWSFWQSLRQNGEPIIALFLLCWLYFLYLKLA